MTKQLEAWPMSGVIKFSVEGQTINHNVVPYYRPISKEKSSTKREGYTKWGVCKRNFFFDDIDNNKFTEKLDLPMHNDSVAQE